MSIEQPNTVFAGGPAGRSAAGSGRSPSRRALGVDVARAVALIGMIAVHVFPEESAEGDISWVFGIAAGRAAALFAVLAGVSIAFVEKRSRGPLDARALAADRAALAVRGLLILLVGLLLGELDTPIETIIPYFGVLFLLALPFYGRSSRTLVLAAAACLVLGPVLRHLLNGPIPEQPDPEADYTLLSAARRPLLFIADMLLTGSYPALLWMVYLCVGIVIGRQVLTSRRLALQLLGSGAALALAAWGASTILLGPAGGWHRLVQATPSLSAEEIAEVLAYGPQQVLMPNTTWWWLTVMTPYSETPFNVLHNLGTALAVLGLTLLVTRRGGTVFSPFAAIGAMTLTLYCGHCVILMLEVLDEDAPEVSLCLQILSFMVFALMWRASMGKGPLEAVISAASDATRHRVREGRARGKAPAPSPDGMRPVPDQTAGGPLAGGAPPPPPDDGAPLRPRKDSQGQRVHSTKPYDT